jgi:hypothetical protein
MDTLGCPQEENCEGQSRDSSRYVFKPSITTDGTVANNNTSSNAQEQLDIQDSALHVLPPNSLNAQSNLSSISLRQSYEERLMLPTPAWAVKHEPGHLSDLNLLKGDLEMSAPIPGYAGQPWLNPKQPSVGFYFWKILAQVPGGKMTLNVLTETLQEWKSTTYKPQSYRRPLSEESCFINEAIPNSSKGGTWRIGTIAEAKAKAEEKGKKEEKVKAKQQKRLRSDQATEASTERLAKKSKEKDTAPTKLPSNPSPTREITAQHTARTPLPSSLSPNSKSTSQHTARTELSSNPSPAGGSFAPADSRRSSESESKTLNDEPSPSTPSRKREQNKKLTSLTSDQYPEWNHGIKMDYSSPLVQPEPESGEILQVSDDSSKASFNKYFYHDHNGPALKMHLQKQKNNRNKDRYGGRGCTMYSTGRCSCWKCEYEKAYGYRRPLPSR